MSELNWHTVEFEPPPPGIFSLSPRRAHHYQTPQHISPTSRRSDDSTPDPCLFIPPPGFFARSQVGGPGSSVHPTNMETSPQAALPPQPGVFAAIPIHHHKVRSQETAEAVKSTTSESATAIKTQQSSEDYSDSDTQVPLTDTTFPPEQTHTGTLAGAKAYRQSLMARLEACTRTAVELTVQIQAVDIEIEAGTESLIQRQKHIKKAKKARARERKKCREAEVIVDRSIR
ncbi:hypothetical protein VMCG_10789 [Cytospora schulzeri]|uniref:Uncharacterized protein n=1 Tax=Cytospora schulzeri TaxID=448051 RepID=A0A423VA31_9PEZI|nr:hypothetical protein VMCG_10789 [Valsa malicola]